MRKRFALALAILILVIAFIPSPSLRATPGALDSSFGSGGVAATPFGYPSGNIQVAGAAVQADGKIVVAGGIYIPQPYSYLFGVARYTAAGILDTTFGPNGNGTVTTGIGWYTYAGGRPYSYASALAIQPDGRIVLTGYAIEGTTGVIGLARYTTAGLLDSTFGGNGTIGRTFFSNNSYSQVQAIAVQPDGKIIVAGYAYTVGSPFVMMRLNPNGAPDSSFGVGGIVATRIGWAYGGGSYSGVRDIVLQSDGKILAVGYTQEGNNQYIALARYNTFGGLDSTFGGNSNGTVAIPIFTATQSYQNLYVSAYPIGLALRSDGSILVSGSLYVEWNSGSTSSTFIVCFSAAGTLNNNFGSGGIATLPYTQNIASGIVVQNDNKTVLAFAGLTTGGPVFSLTRFTANGTLDASFGTQGVLASSITSALAQPTAITNQSDGKVIVVGRGQIGTLPGFVVARYTVADTVAPSWSTGKTLVATDITQTSLRLVWTAATDDVGVVSYKVYQGNNVIATLSGTATSYNVTDLSAGTAYTFSIQAGDQAGLWSANGPSLTVTTPSASLLGGALPLVVLVAVIAGFGAAYFLTKPKQPKTG